MPREKTSLLAILEQAIIVDLSTLSGLPDPASDRAASLTRIMEAADNLLRSTQAEAKGLLRPIDEPLPPAGADDPIPF